MNSFKSAVLLAFVALSLPIAIAQDGQQNQPKRGVKTIALMPSQAKNIINKHYRKVEVRSEYPLQVMTGPCHNDYTVQFYCDSDPADIFIRDVRNPPAFTTPRANTVTITVTEY